MSGTISMNWEEEVGGFILACGDIELITHRLCEQFVPPAKHKEGFKKRIIVLINELGTGNPEGASLLKRALGLVDKRNIVAHSPLQLEVYKHRRTGKLRFEHAIVGNKLGDYIDDAQLRELRAEAESVVAGLYIAFSLELVTHARG